jgi:putative ABC transport system permease protein
MNRQDLRFAIRRIIRNYKSNLLIFAGLVIGLTSCLVIYTKISYELSFDKEHTHYKNIYRVVRVTSGLDYTNGGLEYRTGVHFPLPELIKKSIPEVHDVASMLYVYGQKIDIPTSDSTVEKSFNMDDGIVFTEPSFFNIFDFGKTGVQWLKGEGKQILKNPFTAILDDGTAKRLFGDQDPIGKYITVFNTRFKIEGIIKDLPQNTDLPFKVLLSLSTFFENFNPDAVTNWGSLSDNFQCYVLLNKRSDVYTVDKKLKDIYALNAGSQIVEGRQFKLQPLSGVHRDGRFGNYNNRTVSTGLLLALSLIGGFIFLIACFNYSNFFLAESIKQKKQIALKLILGSRPLSIFFQFFTESLLVNLIALIISIQITIPVLKTFSSFIDIPPAYLPHDNLSLFLFMLLLLMTGGILSVVFSFLNLNVNSLSSLLKRSDTGISRNRNLFGRISVILQFVVAQTVIIATMFIVKQIVYINNKDLGYTTENIIFARLPDNANSKLTTLTGELNKIPGIRQISFSSVLPAESHSWSNFFLFINNEKKNIDAEIKSIDSAYLNLYSFRLLSGQNLTSSDTTGAILVNREFLVESGFTDLNEGIGLKIDGGGKDQLRIKGIVGDFNSGSLRDRIRPCVFYYDPMAFNTLNIKLSYSEDLRRSESGVLPGDIHKINEVWQKIFPDQTFNYNFLSDKISDYYKSDQKVLNLFLLFALITIFLCILGILGLSLSMNERRTKEIGLRKVNGAKVTQVIVLLNSDFSRWVIMAFVIAIPIAWFIMHKWLQNFAYKTELSWWIFMMSGILALFIAMLTVSIQSWRAATRNPVEALRYE